MGKIVADQIVSYITERHRSSLPPLLGEIHDHAKEHRFPIVGPDVGVVLFQLARMSGARRVFELGSGFGYSALWFSSALPADGRVICTDTDPENVERGQKYLARAGLAEKVEWRMGDALDMLKADDGEHDIYFMDVDKHQYPDGFDLVFPRMRPGNLFIVDNMLWGGDVADPEDQKDSTLGIRGITAKLFEEPSLVTTILPIRDGVAVALKVADGEARPFAAS